jgi:hypothetical protein
MRPNTKSNGFKYYEYVLIYTDDILSISHQPLDVLTKLDQHYILKKDSIGPPRQYLGAQIGNYSLPDDPIRRRWYMSSEKYVKEAIRNVKGWIADRGLIFKTKASGVLPSGCRLVLDTTKSCEVDEAEYFQQQIGVLRWAIELGRLDITCEVSMLAAYTGAPRIGYLKAMLHIFSYLNQHYRSKLVMDDSYVLIDDELNLDWSEFYTEAKEDIQSSIPEPRGNEVQMTVFVVADHAGDRITRRSRTGVLIYLNRAPIQWYSKKQNSVETSTFGSEFAALRIAIELTKAMRYKLRMLGIPLDGPVHFRVDNMSVVYNTQSPESTLKKKSNAISYHFVREAVASHILRVVAYEESKTNKADILTKIQTGIERQRLASTILY